MIEKICCECGKLKPAKDFYSRSSGLTSRCRKCLSEYLRGRYKLRAAIEGKPVRRRASKHHGESNVPKVKGNVTAQRHRRTLRLYNLTQSEYDKMLHDQNGACKICKRPGKLCIDHDHKTGKVRGLLCKPCNAAIGLFKDNADSLRAAIEYLVP